MVQMIRAKVVSILLPPFSLCKASQTSKSETDNSDKLVEDILEWTVKDKSPLQLLLEF